MWNYMSPIRTLLTRHEQLEVHALHLITRVPCSFSSFVILVSHSHLPSTWVLFWTCPKVCQLALLFSGLYSLFSFSCWIVNSCWSLEITTGEGIGIICEETNLDSYVSFGANISMSWSCGTQCLLAFSIPSESDSPSELMIILLPSSTVSSE